MTARWPDFFIVGAPRSGTTFLYEALRRHPGVFMPFPKEPLYFCSDLNTGTPADRREFITTEEDYLDLFSAAPEEALVGEACVFNLFSDVAAQRIRAERPDARIIISLREPVAQMASFHAVRMSEGQEELPFAAAIDAEVDRSQGRRLPAHAVLVPTYSYRAVASYAAQVERFLDAFPRDRVLILMHDELRSHPDRWLARAATFLNISAEQLGDPGVVNANWQSRWPWLTRATRSQALIATAKRAVPQRLHRQARRGAEGLGRLNRRRIGSPTVPSDLRARLRAELAPDVQRLEGLIGTDLAAWR
ncbi:MAG TPA: sulfotransferase [Candidatus Limnocylindrales bacterium]|nr:sulfotransferase [Candidatus Limnocylindrales bacterium]